jgi:excisionase family DNA binding protein
MTTSEASETLGYTIQHTRYLLREGHLHGGKIGRDWLILRESVAEYATNSKTQPIVPTQKRGRPRTGITRKGRRGVRR